MKKLHWYYIARKSGQVFVESAYKRLPKEYRDYLGGCDMKQFHTKEEAVAYWKETYAR